MKKLIGTLAFFFALVPLANAQSNSGDQRVETRTDTTAETRSNPPTVGDGVRQAGREAKATGKKVRRAVITRCADGRHTIKGQQECREGHGGVSVQN